MSAKQAIIEKRCILLAQIYYDRCWIGLLYKSMLKPCYTLLLKKFCTLDSKKPVIILVCLFLMSVRGILAWI